MLSARQTALAAALSMMMAGAAHGATLTCTAAFRQVESGETILRPSAPFADFDESIVSTVAEPEQEPRTDSSASQRSNFRPAMITVTSRISGDTARGASFFQVTFDLDEASAFLLTGSFNLTGSAGFACVSLLNLAQTATPLVHEVIYAPPFVSGSWELLFAGTLEAGRYTMEAMIYGGGDNQVTQGGIDVIFSIPEPGPAALLSAGLLLMMRRRRRALRIPPAPSQTAALLSPETAPRSCRCPAR